MSRFLTPTKIALLTLISLYKGGNVPAPQAVPFLSILITQILPARSDDHQKSSIFKPRLAIEDLESRLCKLPSGVPGRSMWDFLLKALWAIESFDALNSFFDSLQDLIARKGTHPRTDTQGERSRKTEQILLSPNSPLGIFVRRSYVEYTRLQFDDGAALWRDFALYREPTRAALRLRNPSMAEVGFDANLSSFNNRTLSEILYKESSGRQVELETSNEDIEALLEFQIERMQKTSLRLPDQVRTYLRTMFESGRTAPVRSYYIKYLDAWRAGDYPSSFENLHRYFDYSIQSRDRTFYQYALLNLAILQADFGCFSEAIAAMNETISIARENKDTMCLNFSLSWLFHFGKQHSDELDNIRQTGVLGADTEALTFLKSKSKEAGMFSLLSTTLLAEARQYHLNGDSLSSVFECLSKARHLNLSKNVTTSLGSQMSLESSIFSRIGNRYLAWSAIEIFLECYSHASSEEDILHLLFRAALLDSFKGLFQSAIGSLSRVSPETLRTLKFQHFWSACLSLINLRRALHSSDKISAERYLQQLQSNPTASHDVVLTAGLYAIDLELKKGQCWKAMVLLEDYQKAVRDEEMDMFEKIRLMVSKAQIFDRAGLPQKSFSIAIRAANLALNGRYMAILWDAIGILCKALNGLREFRAAIKLLTAIMPQILETEDGDLAARSYSALADSHMGLAGQHKRGTKLQREYLSRVLETLERAFEEYSRIHHVDGQCEMTAKKAVVMQLNGDSVLANDCAAKYISLWDDATEQRPLVI